MKGKTQIFTINSELESARNIGLPVEVKEDNGEVSKFNDCVVVRWGNSILPLDENKWNYVEYKFVTNPSAAIRLNVNKKRALKLMGEKVNTPKIFDYETPVGQLVVYRPVEHSGGKGFLVREGGFRVDMGFYATEYIKTDTEYRVWFCGDSTMYAKRVHITDDEVPQYPCRSMWGYSFRVDEMPPELHRDTLAAAKQIGLDYGAADVLYKDGKYYFLELNTAPTIDTPRIQRFYQNGLIRLIRNKFPQFDWSELSCNAKPIVLEPRK